MLLTETHLIAIKKQCTLIAIYSRMLRISEYGSEDWKFAEQELDKAHMELREMLDNALKLLQAKPK